MTLPPFHLHPDVLLLGATLAFGYLWAIAKLGPRSVPEGDRPVSPAQLVAFTAGVALMVGATGWPMHDLAEQYLLSVHMVQHMVLSLIAPPLLIWGMPPWMLRRLLSPRPIHWAARRLTRPFVALLVFNTVIILTHWPVVVELTLRHHLVHLGAHVVLFGAAAIMWWPVIAPLPEMPFLSYPGRMLYLFLQSVAPTVPASFLTFGSKPLYPFYAHAPRIWGISALTDQRIAGLIMKIGGGAVLWAVIAVIFFKWFRMEQTAGWDALRWRDVEREVHSELSRR